MNFKSENIMLVKELVEQLLNLPQDARVFCRGYDGGAVDCTGPLSLSTYALAVNTDWYYGPHEQTDNPEEDYPLHEIVYGVQL
jgi:hypothetical protein